MPADADTKNIALRWFGFTPIQRANAGLPIISADIVPWLKVSPQTFYKWRTEWQANGGKQGETESATYLRTKDNFTQLAEPSEDFDAVEYMKKQGLAVAKSFVSMLVSGKATPKSFEIYYQLTGDIQKIDTKVKKGKELDGTDLAKVVRQHNINQRAKAARMAQVQGEPEVLHPDVLPDTGQGTEDIPAVSPVEVSGESGGLDIRPVDPCTDNPEGTPTWY